MVIVLNLFSEQFFLSVYERFRRVICLWVIESFVNGELLGFSTLLLLSLWLVQRKVLRFLFDVEVFNCPAGSVNINHFEIPVRHEKQFANFLSLIYKHLSVG